MAKREILRPGFIEYVAENDVKPFEEEPVGPLRQVRLDLRVLLNQANGTFNTTNAIADDLAVIVVRNLRTQGYLA